MDLYEQLYVLSKEQERLLTERNYDGLLKNLENKQKLIDKINQIDIEMYLNERNDAKEILKKLKRLMEKIKELDEMNSTELRKQYNMLGNKIKTLNKREKIRQGYMTGLNYEAKFIDKKS